MGAFAGIVPYEKKKILEGGALFGTQALRKIPGEKIPNSIFVAVYPSCMLVDIDGGNDNDLEANYKINNKID